METTTPQTVPKGKSGGIIEAPRDKDAAILDAAANTAAQLPCGTTPGQENLSSPQTATPVSAESDESLKRKLAFDEATTHPTAVSRFSPPLPAPMQPPPSNREGAASWLGAGIMTDEQAVRAERDAAAGGAEGKR